MSDYLNNLYLEYYDFKDVLKKHVLDGLIDINILTDSRLGFDEDLNVKTTPKIPILSFIIKDIVKYSDIVFTYKSSDPSDLSDSLNLEQNSKNDSSYEFLPLENKNSILLANGHYVKSKIVKNFKIECHAIINKTKQNIFISNKKEKDNDSNVLILYVIDYNNPNIINDLTKIYKNVVIENFYKTTFENRNLIPKILNHESKKIYFKQEYLKNVKLSDRLEKIIKLYNPYLVQKINPLYKSSIINAFYYQKLYTMADTLIFKNGDVSDFLPYFINQKKYNDIKHKNTKEITENNIIKFVRKKLIKELIKKDIEYESLTKGQKLVIDNAYNKYVLTEIPNCEHFKIMETFTHFTKNTRLDSSTIIFKPEFAKCWEELVKYVNIDDMSCNTCEFKVMCSHVYYRYDQLFKNYKELEIESDKPSFLYKLNKNIIMNYSIENVEIDSSTIYCKECGGSIGSAYTDEVYIALTNIYSSSSTSDNLKSKDDPSNFLNDLIYKNTRTILQNYANINIVNLESKTIINLISGMIKPYLENLEKQIYKNKTITKQDVLLTFHIRLYVFMAILTISQKTQSISFIINPEDKKSNMNDIKNVLNVVFNYFKTQNDKLIKVLYINNVDIKNLMMQYFKNLSINSISIVENNKENTFSSLSYDPFYCFLNIINSVYAKGNNKINIDALYLEFKPKTIKNKPVEDNRKMNELFSKVKLDKYNGYSYLACLYYLNRLQNDKDIANIESFTEKKEVKILKMPFNKVKHKYKKLDMNFSSKYDYKLENINLFFEFYSVKCPIKGDHKFENLKCVKCNVLEKDLLSKNLKYFTEYKTQFSKIILKKKNESQSILNDLFNTSPKKETTPSKSKTSKYNSITIDKSIIKQLAALLNIKSDKIVDGKLSNRTNFYLENLGCFEKLDYDIENITINNTYSRFMKVKNCIYYFILNFCKLTNKYDISPIYKNYDDRFETSEPTEFIINDMLNAFYSEVLNILKKYSTNKSIMEIVINLMSKILQFDEILSNYNYGEIREIIKKNKDALKSLIDDSDYLDYEIDKAKIIDNDIFDESLFD